MCAVKTNRGFGVKRCGEEHKGEVGSVKRCEVAQTGQVESVKRPMSGDNIYLTHKAAWTYIWR